MARTMSTLLGAGVPLIEAVDIVSGVMSNVYFKEAMEDAKEEMIRMEELNAARAELNKTTGEKPVTQKMFRAI